MRSSRCSRSGSRATSSAICAASTACASSSRGARTTRPTPSPPAEPRPRRCARRSWCCRGRRTSRCSSTRPASPARSKPSQERSRVRGGSVFALRVVPRRLLVAAVPIAVGVVVIPIYVFGLPMGGQAQDVVYDTIGVASALAIAGGVAINRPKAPVPWLLFAAGNLLFAAADILFNLDNAPPVPSAADAVYLTGYAFLIAGVALMVVNAGGHHRVAALGEIAILTVAFALFQWDFRMSSVVHGPGSLAARSVTAAYPAMDILLLAGLAGFFVTAAWRTPSFRLLAVSILALLVGDELYGIDTSYRNGDWIDAFWLVSYLVWASAALHPSMRDLSMPYRVRRVRVSPWRLVLLTAALLSAPFVLVVQLARGAPLEVPAAALAGTIISVFVMLRLAGILRALERLRLQERSARAEAETMQRLLSEQNERLLES